MSNVAPQQICLTTQQLSRYFGFHSLKDWNSLYDVCLPNFMFSHYSEPILELGNVANIKTYTSSKTPVELPANFLKVVHCDIGYSDCKTIGNGALYSLIVVDQAACYSCLYLLWSLHRESLKATFSRWLVDCGSALNCLYTNFDSKILEGPTASFSLRKNVNPHGAPPGRQNQNGLVERAWQTMSNMAHAYITGMQMPKAYWYWALPQSVQAMNYLPCTVEGFLTIPHELVYGVKPDLQALFCMFSTG